MKKNLSYAIIVGVAMALKSFSTENNRAITDGKDVIKIRKKLKNISLENNYISNLKKEYIYIKNKKTEQEIELNKNNTDTLKQEIAKQDFDQTKILLNQYKTTYNQVSNAAKALDTIEKGILKYIFNATDKTPTWDVNLEISGFMGLSTPLNNLSGHDIGDFIKDAFDFLVNQIKPHSRYTAEQVKILGKLYGHIRKVMNSAWNGHEIPSWVTEKNIKKIKDQVVLKSKIFNRILKVFPERARSALQDAVKKTGGKLADYGF